VSIIAIVYLALSGVLSSPCSSASASASSNRVKWPALPRYQAHPITDGAATTQRQSQCSGMVSLVFIGVTAVTIVQLLLLQTSQICPIPLPCPKAVPHKHSLAITQLNKDINGYTRQGGGSNHRRLAIVMPFIASQVDRLLQSLESWHTHSPCVLADNGDAPMNGAQISLVLYYDGDLDNAPLMADGRTLRVYLLDHWQQLPVQTRACVSSGVQMMSAYLTPAENVHPDGPCIQHYRLHQILSATFDHFFQMEPDVTPIQVTHSFT
jgi:hypothetical protein